MIASRSLSAAFACAVAAVTLVAADASATSIIKDPNPPKYKVEIEPKLNLGFFGLYNYGGNAWGPGVRFSIPVMSPGFIKKINDSVAISFGADFIRYSGYRNDYYWCNNRGRDCVTYYNNFNHSFWALHLPVTLQWNFWLTDKWSVFAEGGLTIRHAFYQDDPYCATYGCRTYDKTNFYGTFFVGGRFHFTENIALTMRLGHPIDASIGISFFL